MAANVVVVNIYGDEYPITGVTDAAHISRVADYVNARMTEIARVSKVKAKDKIAILAAMSIASELLERSDELASTDKTVETRLDLLLEQLERDLPVVSEGA